MLARSWIISSSDLDTQGPTFSIQVDLTAVPQPTGTVAVQPGDTWNFQAWYRDLGGTNNFTDAVSVTFQ